MTNVVFVGDKPSRTNVDSRIAFVGAKCFPRLVEWIRFLKPDYYVCYNISTPEDFGKIENLKSAGFKVVALGAKAAEILDGYNIVHFQLPHPSGRNRLLNDRAYVERELKVCYDYIHDYLVGVVSEN